MRRHLRWICLAGVAVSGAVQADSGATDGPRQELDIDISIVEPGTTPDQIINRIPLPPPVVTDTQTAVEPTVAPETEAIEEALDDIQRTTDQVVEDAAQSVTDSVSDAISSGDISELPKDITDSLPDDTVNDLVDDATDGITDDDTLPDPVLDQALDELEGSLDDADGSLNDAQNALPAIAPDDAALSPENTLPDDLGNDYQNALDELDTEIAPELDQVPEPDIEVPLNQDQMIDQEMIDDVQPPEVDLEDDL